MQIKFKKRVRLKDFNYKGYYGYFITLCTFDKKSVFNNKILVESLVNALREKSKFYNFKVWGYCFMPDHLHLLIEGSKEDSDMKQFISAYKQHTGFYYKKRTGKPLWQINYYEHVLTKEETIKKVLDYIFENPVRKRIVKDYREYEYLGSFEFDVNQY